MHALKTMWRILISLPIAVVWMIMAGLLFIGWGLPQVDRFIRGWNASMEDEVDGPIHVGPLEKSERGRGEGIG